MVDFSTIRSSAWLTFDLMTWLTFDLMTWLTFNHTTIIKLRPFFALPASNYRADRVIKFLTNILWTTNDHKIFICNPTNALTLFQFFYFDKKKLILRICSYKILVYNMDKNQIDHLKQIEKYIPEEYDKQLNKHWRFFMDPKHPLCTFKVTHV